MADLRHLPSRRGFLVGMAGASLMFGFARGGAAVETVQDGFRPTVWYGIDRDGIVTVNIIRAEMGQYIGTALARILADELEADWGKVRIVEVDSDPRWGYMVTGGKLVGLDDLSGVQSRRRRRPRSHLRGRSREPWGPHKRKYTRRPPRPYGCAGSIRWGRRPLASSTA
jgi:Molybdopterin cofactor-binding domain